MIKYYILCDTFYEWHRMDGGVGGTGGSGRMAAIEVDRWRWQCGG